MRPFSALCLSGLRPCRLGVKRLHNLMLQSLLGGLIRRACFNLPDNRLATGLNVHVFDRNLLLPLAPVLVQRRQLMRVERHQLVSKAHVRQ